MVVDPIAFYREDAGEADARGMAARLARDLRDGAFRGDPARTAEIHRILEARARARARVAESNPKYLAPQKP